MKRAMATAGCAAGLCLAFWLCFHSLFTDHLRLKNDIDRQLSEIVVLTENGAPAAHAGPAPIANAPEAISLFSSRMSSFGIAERALVSEKRAQDPGGWDEWGVEASCEGTLEDICRFIESLESEGIYHSLNASIELKNGEEAAGGRYGLNAALSFYARP